MNKRKNQEKIILILAILISFLYIFAANKYVSRDANANQNLGEYDTYKAKVVEIVSVDIENYDIGGEILVGKNINFDVKILNGEFKGEIVSVNQQINPYMAIQPPEIELNDKILISQAFSISEVEESNEWTMIEHVRTDAIMLLLLVFFVCLVIFGRMKGVLTMVSLILTCLSIFLVFIPSILGGHNIFFWALQICVFIIIMTLLIVNGWNMKSLSAAIGCVGGVFVAGILTVIMDKFLTLTGMIDDESVFLHLLNPDNPIDLKAIIFASIIIGAVGAIMDVAISIASSLNEIKAQNENISFGELFSSGITIGRDIMGTMTNTLILAYIGSSLSMVLLLVSNTPSLTYLVNTEMIIVEILQALVGSLGILLTLPLTSLVSAFLYTKKLK